MGQGARNRSWAACAAALAMLLLPACRGSIRSRGTPYADEASASRSAGSARHIDEASDTRRARHAAPSTGDSPTYTDEEVEAALTLVRDELASCVPFSTGAFPIDILFTVEGRLLRDDSALISGGTAACLDRTLAAVTLPRRARLGRTVSLDVAAVWADERPRPRSGASASDAMREPARRVRAALAPFAPELLRCTGGIAVTLVVSWAGDGSLGASIPVAEGSAAETCARALVSRLSIAPPGNAGVVALELVPR